MNIEMLNDSSIFRAVAGTNPVAGKPYALRRPRTLRRVDDEHSALLPELLQLSMDHALTFQFLGSPGNLWALQAQELGAAAAWSVPSLSSHRASAIVGPGEGFAYL